MSAKEGVRRGSGGGQEGFRFIRRGLIEGLRRISQKQAIRRPITTVIIVDQHYQSNGAHRALTTCHTTDDASCVPARREEPPYYILTTDQSDAGSA
eukprot:7048-Prorocentrum_minimum.AAC.1